MTQPIQSLVQAGSKIWLDSIDPDLVQRNRALGATGATWGIGRATCGPGLNSSSTPMASSGTMMSEKMMAASSAKRRSGCRLASTASSGVRQTVRKSARSRNARYSGR